jgi:arsenate reductase
MRAYNILFLCTGNSARSIMAEAIATTTSVGRLIGYSAGSHPGGVVNPFAVEMVQTLHYPVEKLRSKSWDEFATPDAPPMDFIITVCDNAAGEVCPVWPGKPVTAHWGFPDPAAVTGSDEQKRQAFRQVFAGINNRIKIMLALPPEKLDAASIQAELRNIGNTPATPQ